MLTSRLASSVFSFALAAAARGLDTVAAGQGLRRRLGQVAQGSRARPPRGSRGDGTLPPQLTAQLAVGTVRLRRHAAADERHGDVSMPPCSPNMPPPGAFSPDPLCTFSFPPIFPISSSIKPISCLDANGSISPLAIARDSRQVRQSAHGAAVAAVLAGGGAGNAVVQCRLVRDPTAPRRHELVPPAPRCGHLQRLALL